MTAPHDPAAEPMAAPAPAAPASTPTTPAARPASGNNADWDRDEERHPPVTSKDEGPLESLGRSVSEVVTGADDKPAKPKA